MASPQQEGNEECLEVDMLDLDFSSSEVAAPAQSQAGSEQEARGPLEQAKKYAMYGVDSTKAALESGKDTAVHESPSIPVASLNSPNDIESLGAEVKVPIDLGSEAAAAAVPQNSEQCPPDLDRAADLTQDDVLLSFEDQMVAKSVDDEDGCKEEEDEDKEDESDRAISNFLRAQREDKADDEFNVEFPGTPVSEQSVASKTAAAVQGNQLHSPPIISDVSVDSQRLSAKKGEEATSTSTVSKVEDVTFSPGQQTAHDEWDKVQTIQPVFAAPDVQRVAPSVEEKPVLKYHQALEALSSADYSTIRRTIRTQVSRSGLQALKNFFFGPPKLHSSLWPERELVFCFAGTPLQNGNQIHLDMLQSVYRQITGSRFECQRYGAHWESIGFQGNDPATDLRAAGILAVLQMMSLIGNPKVSKIARDTYRLSQDAYQNFPFCVIGINLTRTCLQVLREDLLNRECNRQNTVLNVVNEFYAGLFLKFYGIWRNGKTIIDSGHVMEAITQYAKKNTKQVFLDVREYMSQSSSNAPNEAAEFTDVCSSQR